MAKVPGTRERREMAGRIILKNTTAEPRLECFDSFYIIKRGSRGISFQIMYTAKRFVARNARNNFFYASV